MWWKLILAILILGVLAFVFVLMQSAGTKRPRPPGM